MEQTGDFIEGGNSDIDDLCHMAFSKNKEVQALITKKDEIIQQLSTEIQEIGTPGEETSLFREKAQKLLGSLLRELVSCLQEDDFSFNGMKGAKNEPNLKSFIDFICGEFSNRSLSDLLNSKY